MTDDGRLLSELELAREVKPENGRGVGALLRASRLRVGQRVEDVANALYIRSRHLEAIEEGRFQDLPGPAYALGFIRAYAGYLGLDSDEVARRFKAEASGLGKTQMLSFPSPVTEGSIPGAAILLVGLVIAGLAYGAWTVGSSRDQFFTDLISPLPDRLAAFLGGGGPAPAGAPAPAPAPAEAMANPAPEIVAPAAAPSPAPTADPDRGQPTAAPAAVSPPAEPRPVAGAAETPAASPPPAATAGAAALPPGAAREIAAARTPEPPSAAPTPEAPPAARTPEAPPAASPATTATAPRPAAAAETPAASPPPSSSARTPPAPPARPAVATNGTPPATPLAATPAPPIGAAGAPSSSPPVAPESPAAGLPAASGAPGGGPAADDAEGAAGTAADRESAALAAAFAAAPTDDGGGVAGAAPGSPEPRIVVRARMASWIQIRDDVANQLLLTRLMRAGDTYRVPDRPGLKLLTGNAGALEILVDGEAVPPIGPVGAVRRDVTLDAMRLREGTAAPE